MTMQPQQSFPRYVQFFSVWVCVCVLQFLAREHFATFIKNRQRKWALLGDKLSKNDKLLERIYGVHPDRHISNGVQWPGYDCAYNPIVITNIAIMLPLYCC